jgi:signal transduction histidine kinase
MVIENIPSICGWWWPIASTRRNHGAREKGIRLSAEIPPEFPGRFTGDPLRMRQILNNLLSNAVKFTEVGYVVVRLNGAPDPGGDRFNLELQVADTGCGIAPRNCR